MDMPLKDLQKLLDTLRQGSVAEFEYEDEKQRLHIVLGGAAPQVASTPAIPAPLPSPVRPPTTEPAVPVPSSADADSDTVWVTSPFVGTFYRAPAPDAAPFVQVGSRVSAGQTLCIVEAMKLMNEIEAEVSGTILEILGENGVSVEFGQRLFKLKRS